MAELEQHVGYQLRRAQLAVFAHFNRVFAAIDLRPAQFSLLDVVGRNPGILQTRAGARLGIQKANFVPFVDGLQERGLVVRVPIDGRSNGLKLTAKGRALLRRARRLVDKHEAAVTDGLTNAERRTLVELLARLTAQAELALSPDQEDASRSA
jgi:DNA-binding MarR family transcriptional regulator